MDHEHYAGPTMRITALTIALALLPAPVFAAKDCKKGKPCGNTCIAVSKTCHVGTDANEQTSQQSRYTFIVDTPDPVEPPTSAEEPAVTAPPPPQKPCRREDFASFDAFVECRVAEQGTSATPVVAPPVDLAEQARQREASEARAELGRRSKQQATADAEEELRTRRTLLALLISGSVLDAAGIGLLAAAAGTGEAPAATGSFGAGPTCTIGKRCGNTCIAAELTCHTSTAGGSFESNPALRWSGVAAMAVGTGLLVAALVIYRRNDSRTALIVDARGVGLRF